ncbi:aldolase/citrate lyase family protein [Actinomycetospora endophytica]|uniref:Aldolase/citrate lyase family protein n=1 Tax=Actinomycetospora endophytica TaxID=2291215 RepID=A0ABS8P4G5_9PSEU|nr:aldolase/citrate lyase family protein [Actinomycetospora endophytica]MCD2192440.1 aldolase/citrate lyase family protein [Actinomycetospora endophytica]
MSDPAERASDAAPLTFDVSNSTSSPGLADGFLDALDARLAVTDAALDADEAARARLADRDPEPVHVCYLPADQVTATTAADWGDEAAAVLERYAGDPDLPAVLGLTPAELREALPRVARTLTAQPVADLRADLEDGYGHRTDAEEDADADASGRAVAAMLDGPRAPRRAGPRVKSMERATRRRGLRSLARFTDAFLTAGGDPARLRVTLPKISAPEQVASFVEACAALEAHHGIGPLPIELQIETARGAQRVDELVAAAGARAAGLHYGTYDYSAALGIAPDQQRADHPAAEDAKFAMQRAGAAAGVPVCDGSSAILAVGDRDQVFAAWRVQARIVRRALDLGITQGWDMHPAMIPARLAVVIAFHREGLDAVKDRLRAYRAGASGAVLDEPATERALVGFLRRGQACGAIDE